MSREDTFTSTVDGAAAHAQTLDPSYIGNSLPSNRLPGPIGTHVSEPYISLPDVIRQPGYARKPCDVCGIGPIPHFKDAVAHHTAPDGAGRCPGGTVMFG